MGMVTLVNSWLLTMRVKTRVGYRKTKREGRNLCEFLRIILLTRICIHTFSSIFSTHMKRYLRPLNDNQMYLNNSPSFSCTQNN